MMRFSLIITIDKCFEYIDKCLSSIFEQTFKDYEIIVVKNIKDNLLDRKLNKYKNKINVIDTESSNLKSIGIDNSNGEYLMFIEPNDYLEINTLSILDKASKSSSDIIRYQIREFDDNHEKVISEVSFKKCNGHDALLKIIKYRYVYQSFTYILKTSYIKNNKIDGYYSIINYIYNCDTCISIGDILYNHRTNIDVNVDIFNNIKELYKLLDNISDENIQNYIVLNIVNNISKLNGNDYKNMYDEFKNNNIYNKILDKKIKMLTKINIKLASRLIKW